MRIKPGDSMPSLDAGLVGGDRWSLAAENPTLAGERPVVLALLAFYRGFFCPVCRVWLGDLDRLVPEFTKRGVSTIALSCDSKESADKSVADWGLKNLRVGYKLDPEAARKAGLYVSEGRGLNPVTNQKEPMMFAEPAVLLTRPDGTLYAAWIQSIPYARPHAAEILTAVDNVISAGLKPPRGSA